MVNTVVALIATLISVMVGILAAYALARLRFRGGGSVWRGGVYHVPGTPIVVVSAVDRGD